jgi:hypothetical protein
VFVRIKALSCSLIVWLVFLGCAGCGGPALTALKTIRATKLAGDAASDAFISLYSAEAAQCRAKLDGLSTPDARLAGYKSCMVGWDATAAKVAGALDALGAAQRLAYDAVAAFATGGDKGLMDKAMAALGPLVSDVLALVDAIKATAKPASTATPASIPGGAP